MAGTLEKELRPWPTTTNLDALKVSQALIRMQPYDWSLDCCCWFVFYFGQVRGVKREAATLSGWLRMKQFTDVKKEKNLKLQ